jgi:hypothetical protein
MNRHAIKTLPFIFLLLVAGCGSDSGGPAGSPTPSPGATLEIDANGTAIAYLQSDNVDPTTVGPDDATSHRIASLPSGLVQVCHYTLSQGVNWQVWAIAGSQDSLDFAHAYCQRNGQ